MSEPLPNIYPHLRTLSYNLGTAVTLLLDSRDEEPADRLDTLRVVLRLVLDEATLIESRLPPADNPEGAPDGEERRDDDGSGG